MEPTQIKLIHQFLENSAELYPDKCALVHGDIRLTYDNINHSSNRLANWLIGQGMEIGDRAVLLLENSKEYLISYYAVLKAGGVAVPLNPELKPDSLDWLLAGVSPRFIISSAKGERSLRSIDLHALPIQALILSKAHIDRADGSVGIIPFDETLACGDDENPSLALDDSSLASIIFTSGSTGKPKGVMLLHRNIVANTRSIVDYLNLTCADIQMVVLPFFYVMGKSLLNTHIAAGGTIVINNSFAYPASVIHQMIEEQVTGFSGVPSTFAYLLHRSPLKDCRDRLPSLRYCSQAGGHLACHIKEELLKALPEHTQLFVMYGATEASARLSYVEPGRLREKMDSIGIPIPGVSLKVLDESGNELPDTQIGELVANGPNIMKGYWQDPVGTANVLDRHGYHTGDMGFRDYDGYFHVTGRKDSQLKVGGHRIDPVEIEDAIIATDLVIESTVLGIPDRLAGQRLVAAAVPISGDTTEREILAECAKVLPRHKLPSTIHLVKVLPKNSSGKVDRKECMNLLFS